MDSDSDRQIKIRNYGNMDLQENRQISWVDKMSNEKVLLTMMQKYA